MFELLEQLLRGWDVCVLPQESRLSLSGYAPPRFSTHTYVCMCVEGGEEIRQNDSCARP